jgi:hypothetical protein
MVVLSLCAPQVRGGGKLANLLVLWIIVRCQYAKRPIFKQKPLAFLFG